jgi:hypothetical protein
MGRKKKVADLDQKLIDAAVEGAKFFIKKGEVVEASSGDVLRAQIAVRRRHPRLKEGRIQRRVRIRLKLLGIVRTARSWQPFGGAIADLTKSLEAQAIELVNERNKKAPAEDSTDA